VSFSADSFPPSFGKECLSSFSPPPVFHKTILGTLFFFFLVFSFPSGVTIGGFFPPLLVSWPIPDFDVPSFPFPLC